MQMSIPGVISVINNHMQMAKEHRQKQIVRKLLTLLPF